MLQNRLSFRCVIHVPLSFETETRLRPGLTLSGGEILAAHAAHADVPCSGLGAPVVGVSCCTVSSSHLSVLPLGRSTGDIWNYLEIIGQGISTPAP